MAFASTALTDTVATVTRMLTSDSAVQTMSDHALLAASDAIAAARRELDARGGWVAAEIAHRSRRELGYDGLAQRQGFRTPEALIQNVTGATRAEAITLVRIGTMVAETAASDALAEPSSDVAVDGSERGEIHSASNADPNRWRDGVARAVSIGELSYAQAEAIRAGLGEPTAVVTGELLADAAAVPIDAATSQEMPLTVDELRRMARQLRDSVDAEGLLDQEKAQQDAQYVKAWRRADGMVAGSLLLDRENGAYFLSVIDQLISPRRGGPRFVTADDVVRAKRLIDDTRSTERIAADGIIQLLRIGTAADPNTVYGSRKPAVRIVVTRDTMIDAPGTDHRGILEDTGESISIGAIERNICESGVVEVAFDSCGRPLDVGRDQRLFTARQKVALAVRDGGCMIDGCDRPPSWTEAHHIDHYVEHRGLTNTEDGILLCRYHHLLLHNSGWRITRIDDRYFLRKSRSEDPHQTLIPLHSKNPLTRVTAAREHSRRQRAG